MEAEAEGLQVGGQPGIHRETGSLRVFWTCSREKCIVLKASIISKRIFPLFLSSLNLGPEPYKQKF